MIKEIAVDPDLMAEWSWFLRIFRDTGPDEGRLISLFPGKWKQKVVRRAWELVSEGINQDIKVQSLVARMQDPSFDARLLKTLRDYNVCEGTWLERALAQEDRFDAIISKQSHPSNAYIRAEDEYFEDERFAVARQIRVARNAEALVSPCRRLIVGATSLKVIEPHFAPEREQMLRPFRRLLEEVAAAPRSIAVVELHTIRSTGFNETTRRNFRAHLAPCIPSSLSVSVHFWGEKPGGENLHPRFVLTNQGGLKYDYGLDEGTKPLETTIVDLLTREMHAQVWAEYNSTSNTFDLDPTEHILHIQGTQT